jgi:hypothetical protein
MISTIGKFEYLHKQHIAYFPVERLKTKPDKSISYFPFYGTCPKLNTVILSLELVGSFYFHDPTLQVSWPKDYNIQNDQATRKEVINYVITQCVEVMRKDYEDPEIASIEVIDLAKNSKSFNCIESTQMDIISTLTEHITANFNFTLPKRAIRQQMTDIQYPDEWKSITMDKITLSVHYKDIDRVSEINIVPYWMLYEEPLPKEMVKIFNLAPFQVYDRFPNSGLEFKQIFEECQRDPNMWYFCFGRPDAACYLFKHMLSSIDNGKQITLRSVTNADYILFRRDLVTPKDFEEFFIEFDKGQTHLYIVKDDQLARIKPWEIHLNPEYFRVKGSVPKPGSIGQFCVWRNFGGTYCQDFDSYKLKCSEFFYDSDYPPNSATIQTFYGYFIDAGHISYLHSYKLAQLSINDKTFIVPLMPDYRVFRAQVVACFDQFRHYNIRMITKEGKEFAAEITLHTFVM